MMEQIWKLVLKREECPHVVRKVLTGEQSPLRSTGEITQAVQLLTRDEVVEVAFAFFFGGISWSATPSSPGVVSIGSAGIAKSSSPQPCSAEPTVLPWRTIIQIIICG